MKSIITLLALVLLSTSVSYGAEQKSFEELFHIEARTAEEQYGKETYQRLKKASEDFNAVLAGKTPKNAKEDKNAFLPADGGTSFYIGDGYKLAVVMSLNGVMRGEKYFGGYMYGPQITFNENLLSGNSPSISQVTFYPREELMKLLGRK